MSDGKTVELLSSALNSLGALIDAEESKEAPRKVDTPRQSSPTNKSSIRCGYTRTTASWKNRFVASETEREYRRKQKGKLEESIPVAWASPKSGRNAGSRLFSQNELGNSQYAPNESRCSSIHSQTLSATMLSSPVRGKRELVASTKSVTDSWGSQWGLRGSSPVPKVNEQTVFSAVDGVSFGSYFDHTTSKKTNASTGTNFQPRITDHTRNWIIKRREMLLQRNRTPDVDTVAANENRIQSKINSKIRKKRLKAAKSSFVTAMETKMMHDKLEENEVALHQLVSSLPRAYRHIVERQILSNRSQEPFDRPETEGDDVSSIASTDGSIESTATTQNKGKHVFNDRAFRAHLERQKAARDRAAGVPVLGANWSKSPTKFAPFKLSVGNKTRPVASKSSIPAKKAGRKKKKKRRVSKKKGSGKGKAKKKKTSTMMSSKTSSGATTGKK